MLFLDGFTGLCNPWYIRLVNKEPQPNCLRHVGEVSSYMYGLPGTESHFLFMP